MWRIITLDDGRLWLTDGTNGMEPGAAFELLTAGRDLLHAIDAKNNANDPAKLKAIKALTEYSSVDSALEDMIEAVAKAGDHPG